MRVATLILTLFLAFVLFVQGAVVYATSPTASSASGDGAIALLMGLLAAVAAAFLGLLIGLAEGRTGFVLAGCGAIALAWMAWSRKRTARAAVAEVAPHA